MKDTRLALPYAKAILSLAKDSKKESELNDNMILISKVIKENKEFEVMLKSPVVKSNDKIKVLNAIFSDKTNNISLGLFQLLAENKRISLLNEIAKQYLIIYDFDKHLQVASITTAEPISREIEDKVLDKILALTGKKARLKNEVIPSILGGFILRVGDMQYDASISNYLNELKKEFSNSHYIPKI